MPDTQHACNAVKADDNVCGGHVPKALIICACALTFVDELKRQHHIKEHPKPELQRKNERRA